MITDKLLAETNLTLDDIDFYYIGSINKIWEAQVKELGIPFERA